MYSTFNADVQSMIDKKRDRYLNEDSWHTRIDAYIDESDLLNNAIGNARRILARNRPSPRPKQDTADISAVDTYGRDVERTVFVDELFIPLWRNGGAQIMSKREQQAYQMYLDGCSYSEIESALNTSSVGARMMVSRARAKHDASTSGMRELITSLKTQTPRKWQAWLLYLEALAKDVAYTPYVAERMNISINRVTSYISDVRSKILVTNAESHDRIEEIRRIKENLIRSCAMCNEVTPSPAKPFCTLHHRRFVVDKEFYPYSQLEIQMRIEQSDRDHAQKAREIIKRA